MRPKDSDPWYSRRGKDTYMIRKAAFIVAAMFVVALYYIGVQRDMDTFSDGIQSLTHTLTGHQNIVESTIVTEEEQEEVYYYPQIPKEVEHSSYE